MLELQPDRRPEFALMDICHLDCESSTFGLVVDKVNLPWVASWRCCSALLQVYTFPNINTYPSRVSSLHRCGGS